MTGLLSVCEGLHEGIRLLQGGVRYSFNTAVLAEFPRAAYDMFFGANPGPKQPGFVYADLHAHIPDTVRMRDLVDEATQRVDVLALTTRTPEYNGGHLGLELAVEKLNRESIEHHSLGKNVVRIDTAGGAFYLVRGMELYTRENQAVIMVGLEKQASHGNWTLDATIGVCRDNDTFWFFDHPFTVAAPGIGFRYPTRKEMQMRLGWLETYSPVLEVGNHQNTLWMFPSNVLARRIASERGLPGIANSDSHLRLEELGLSRTGIPRALFDASSEGAFFNSLRKAFSSSDSSQLLIQSGYSSIASFARYMVLPFVRQALEV